MNTDNRIPAERETDKRRRDVAYAMVRSGKRLDEILADFSVTDEEFSEWIRDGQFGEYAAAFARGFAQANAPYVWESLLSETREGSIPAIKLYFEIWNKCRETASGSAAGPPWALSAMRSEIFGTGGDA